MFDAFAGIIKSIEAFLKSRDLDDQMQISMNLIWLQKRRESSAKSEAEHARLMAKVMDNRKAISDLGGGKQTTPSIRISS